MAYMLDHERGVVVIAPVEYLGEAPVERVRPRAIIHNRGEESDREIILPRVLRRAPVREVERAEQELEDHAEVIVDKTPHIESGKVAGEGIDPSGLTDIGHSKPSRTQTIIPPHLRGIMKKDGATEKRDTIG